ncbi:hypothetical protein ACFPFV_07975 [Salinicoccus siamensis]|uniref:Uncharacterized protein n=1 Tax=Salinicoccus siamensis TaxID=381830 RepID=A0ABV5Z249_9STAP
MLVASLVGSSIEWFDFFLYAAVATIVFNNQFFVTDDPVVSTMFAYIWTDRPYGTDSADGAPAHPRPWHTRAFSY